MDFLKSISEIKREPLDLKEALERVAYSHKEIGKYEFEANTILRKNEYDFLNINHVRLEEVFPSLLGFDYDQYKMLRNESKLQESCDSIVRLAEEDIKEIQKELPESARKELLEIYEKTITKYKRQGSLYSSGGSALCNRIDHLLELFRRAYISGDVAICGDWIDLDTIVDTKVFFEWAQRNGFYIPEEVSCFFGDSTATIQPTADATERGHKKQEDGLTTPLSTDSPEDYAQRLKSHRLDRDEIKYRLYRLSRPEWKMTQWKAHCIAEDVQFPPRGLKGEADRNDHKSAYWRSERRFLERTKNTK